MVSDTEKKRRWLTMAGACIGVVIIVLVLGRMYFPPPATAPAASRQPPLAPSLEEIARDRVSVMSDEMKIGQMMIIGIEGTTADESVRQRLQDCGFGGIVLFDRNLKTPGQVQALIGSLQQTALETFALPLFVALDEEGGSVVRMAHYINAPPSAAQLGWQGNPQKARDLAVQTAAELRALGINVNFAPVLDLGLPGGRSYGVRQDVVTRYAAAVGSGYAQGGMIFTLKHFPGLGKAKVDPHEDIGEIDVSRSVLEAEDIAPFRALLQSLWMEDFFVMMSHLKYPALDKEYPASLSRRIITDLLKDSYGFRGLVITDDLEMGALSKHYAFEELGVGAVAAGADLVLVCHEYDHIVAVYNGMLQALQNGTLDRAQVNRSVENIVRVKLRMQERGTL